MLFIHLFIYSFLLHFYHGNLAASRLVEQPSILAQGLTIYRNIWVNKNLNSMLQLMSTKKKKDLATAIWQPRVWHFFHCELNISYSCATLLQLGSGSVVFCCFVSRLVWLVCLFIYLFLRSVFYAHFFPPPL